MNHKERFFATIERKPVDRPACWLGMPVPAAHENLFRYFKVNNLRELKLKIGTDIWEVDVPYNHPPNNHIAMAFDFPKKGLDLEHRTLTAPGFFEDYFDPLKDDIDNFDWPDPAEHIDPQQCIRLLDWQRLLLKCLDIRIYLTQFMTELLSSILKLIKYSMRQPKVSSMPF